MNEKISVLMPVYKTPIEWLDEAIESILGQTYGNFDFIIVNDRAPEAETIRLREWSLKDNRIRLIEHEENLGCAEALNTGLRACQTRLVARMDSDDRSLPQRLEKQLEYFTRHPEVDVLGTSFCYYHSPSKVHHRPLTNEACHFSLMYCSPLAHPTVMYKREVIDCLGGYNKERLYAEDYDLWARGALQGLNIENMQEVLLAYRYKKCDENADYIRKQKDTSTAVSDMYSEAFLKKLCVEGVECLGKPQYDFKEVLEAYEVYLKAFRACNEKEDSSLKKALEGAMRHAYKKFSGSAGNKLFLKLVYKVKCTLL